MDRIDSAQVDLWPVLREARPFTADDLSPFGVQIAQTPEEVSELRRQYGLPNALDVGRGVFVAHAALLFIDDDTGRVVAYVPPDVANRRRSDEVEAHDLLPAHIVRCLPPLYSNEELGDSALAHLKLFTPWSNWTWYASELNPSERLCFGVVVGLEREFGYFPIDELAQLRGPGGLRVERDLHWSPKPLSVCR